MKKIILIITASFLAMAFLPLIPAGSSAYEVQKTSLTIQTSKTQISSANKISSVDDSNKASGDTSVSETGFKDGQSFRILDTGSGEILTVSDYDFCCGALAYEMPPSYSKEALKAQCVACYTHFSRLREQQRESPDSELKGADFSADLSKNEYYLSDAAMKEKWGDQYDSCKKVIEQAVKECAGQVLRDSSGNLIDAAYHAISSGMTENSADIFGFESEYLRAVPSAWDKSSPEYLSEVSVKKEEFIKTLSKEDKAFNGDTDINSILGKCSRTPSGTITEIIIGGAEFSGQRLRELFGLRSACFDLTYKSGSFIFTVRGYGHGVGLSQYGADCMAKQGADYTEILHHYYSGGGARLALPIRGAEPALPIRASVR